MSMDILRAAGEHVPKVVMAGVLAIGTAACAGESGGLGLGEVGASYGSYTKLGPIDCNEDSKAGEPTMFDVEHPQGIIIEGQGGERLRLKLLGPRSDVLAADPGEISDHNFAAPTAGTATKITDMLPGMTIIISHVSDEPYTLSVGVECHVSD